MSNNSIVDSLLSKIDLVELVGHYTRSTSDSNGNYRGCCLTEGGDIVGNICRFNWEKVW